MFPRIMAIPVLCDRCRAPGFAGEADFSHLGDLLAFAPVPRRKRAGGWTAEVQRLFIAALAITGSPRQAAAAVGRAQFGVEQLLRHPQGEAFRAAYTRALALAEETERLRMTAAITTLLRADEPSHLLAHSCPEPGRRIERSRATDPAPGITLEDRARLHAESFHRAAAGEEVPIFRAGRRVGTRRVFNDRMVLHHLKEGGGGGDSTGARKDWITDPREIRIHKLMKENPHWVRSFAETVDRHPRGLYRATGQPWRFGMAGNLKEAIEYFHAAFEAHLDGDATLTEAYNRLFVERLDLATNDEILGHAVAIVECLFPGLPEHYVAALREGARLEGEAQREKLLAARALAPPRADDQEEPRDEPA